MMKILRNGPFRIVLSVLGFCLLVVVGLSLTEQDTVAGPQGETGRLEKMIVADGNVAIDLDMNALSGTRSRSESTTKLNFSVEPNTFFTAMAFNDELRGILPSSMGMAPQDTAALPGRLESSYNNLVIESTPWGAEYELGIRDGKTGFIFFHIEGHQYEYVPADRQLKIIDGRVLMSKEYAESLNRPADALKIVGSISFDGNMRPIEIAQVVNGDVVADKLPAMNDPEAGTVPGPDVVVGDVMGLAQFGSASGDYVGLAVGTDSCNFGTVDLNWFALPNNDHPVIPQNLYRMSGGPNNDQRFEQIGQSSVKHAFTALTQNLCALGCNGVGGSRLGSGCSDPYSASLNAGPSLGSRAWINPFTGFYPRGDSATPPNNHAGHNHNGTSHRILTAISDLSNSQNAGAAYFAEAQYVTPHEFAWCQANPTQCNMNNNVSYRRYNVSGSGSPFTFSPNGSTVRTKPAVIAWPGASFSDIRPDGNNDGIGMVAYKVTNPSPGVWHYEYAVYNQNMDRAIQAFSVPVGNGASVTNIGFHAPPQHPGSANDGTAGSAGYSSAPWTQTLASNSMTWNTETMAQNPNANAIRWGTMYNFRFVSNRPPTTTQATVGFFKTGAPITVEVQAPSGIVAAAVSVSGRVMSASGHVVRNARVSIADGLGNTRTVITNTFGYYRFDGVATGSSYTVSVSAKGFTFSPQNVQINDHISGLNFTAGQDL
jgi:hypothetical protein